MKKINAKKLSLNVETIVALQPEVLADVNGGGTVQITKTVLKVSEKICTAITTVQSSTLICAK